MGGESHRCRNCGAPVKTGWRLPTSCKKCGASFNAQPRWALTAVFLIATAMAVVAAALVRLVTDINGVFIMVGIGVGVLAFNGVQLAMFRFGMLRLTNLNAPADDTRAEYAGIDKVTRAAQAKQLREAIDLAKSLRSSSGDETTAVGVTTSAERAAGTNASDNCVVRCRFRRVKEGDERGIRAMSALATRIVREHFDPIIGTEQNDYMIERFQTPEAIAAQIEEGYEYYFVFPPKDEQREGSVRPIGFLAVHAQGDGELYLSKFYLLKEERGKGYARSMMRLVTQRARKLGCDHVTLNVNRNNYQAILAYEHLGFQKVGERCTDIGDGYVMDDFVYELAL